MTARRALWILLAASTALRLVWICLIPPGHDEAYYYTFALHPDWSYYDHPPLVAWCAWLTRFLFGPHVYGIALRIGFVLLFTASTWLLARLTARFYGPWAGLFSALVFSLAGYCPLAAGSFVLPDGPLYFFWILTLERLTAALTTQHSRRASLAPWTLVGLAWGGALLSKYQSLALPAGSLIFLLTEPTARPWLRRPGPYLALAVGLLLFTPILGWNAAHNWASFRFHGARTIENGLWPRPDHLLLATLGQSAYLFPWVWLVLVIDVFRAIRAPRGNIAGTADRLFLAHVLAPLVLFLAPACFRPLLPHWSLPALLAAFPLVGRSLVNRHTAQPSRVRHRLFRMSVALLAIAALVATHANWGVLQNNASTGIPILPATHDPTIDTLGWRETAEELERRGLLDQPGRFLFTSRWYHSGQLANALQQRLPVLCYNPRDSHAFSQWSHPESWVGRDGILVVVDESSTEPAVYDRWFESISPTASFHIQRAGGNIRQIRLFNCLRQTSPFPSIPSGGNPTPTSAAPTPPRLATHPVPDSLASPSTSPKR